MHKKFKSFLSWPGGKYKLVEEIASIFPKRINRYWEPFVGGGAVFLNLGDRARSWTIADLNPCLVNAWIAVRDCPDGLLELLQAHKQHHCRSYFYKVREEYNLDRGSGVRAAARYIYLNKSCFNGLMRVNKKGEVNSPIGTRFYVPENLLEISEKLQEVSIARSDFSISLDADWGDVVYFDPPYYADRDIHNDYGIGAFTEDDRARMVEVARVAADKGAIVVGSDLDTPYTRKLYGAIATSIHSIAHSYTAGGGNNPLISTELLWVAKY